MKAIARIVLYLVPLALTSCDDDDDVEDERLRVSSPRGSLTFVR